MTENQESAADQPGKGDQVPAPESGGGQYVEGDYGDAGTVGTPVDDLEDGEYPDGDYGDAGTAGDGKQP